MNYEKTLREGMSFRSVFILIVGTGVWSSKLDPDFVSQGAPPRTVTLRLFADAVLSPSDCGGPIRDLRSLLGLRLRSGS